MIILSWISVYLEDSSVKPFIKIENATFPYLLDFKYPERFLIPDNPPVLARTISPSFTNRFSNVLFLYPPPGRVEMKVSLYSLSYIQLSSEFSCAELVKLYRDNPEPSSILIFDVSIKTSLARNVLTLSKPISQVPGRVSSAWI